MTLARIRSEGVSKKSKDLSFRVSTRKCLQEVEGLTICMTTIMSDVLINVYLVIDKILFYLSIKREIQIFVLLLLCYFPWWRMPKHFMLLEHFPIPSEEHGIDPWCSPDGSRRLSQTNSIQYPG
jgi:hypothetical protein